MIEYALYKCYYTYHHDVGASPEDSEEVEEAEVLNDEGDTNESELISEVSRVG